MAAPGLADCPLTNASLVLDAGGPGRRERAAHPAGGAVAGKRQCPAGWTLDRRPTANHGRDRAIARPPQTLAPDPAASNRRLNRRILIGNVQRRGNAWRKRWHRYLVRGNRTRTHLLPSCPGAA